MLILSVFGCPDPSPPAHGFIKRNKDRVEIYCRMSDNKWEIICQEGKWKGHHGNCTAGEKIPVTFGVKHFDGNSVASFVTQKPMSVLSCNAYIRFLCVFLDKDNYTLRLSYFPIVYKPGHCVLGHDVARCLWKEICRSF